MDSWLAASGSHDELTSGANGGGIMVGMKIGVVAGSWQAAAQQLVQTTVFHVSIAPSALSTTFCASLRPVTSLIFIFA